MMKSLSKQYALFGAAFTMGTTVNIGQAFAGGFTAVETVEYENNTFNEILERLTVNVGGVTGFISFGCYMVGLILAIVGIIKIKEHVEEPDKTPLKAGAVRLFVAGALLALPAIINAITMMVNDGDGQFEQMNLKAAKFGVEGGQQP